MKKICLSAAIAVAVISFSACGNNNAAADAPKADSTAGVINPPDNSSATNPSMADTAFSKNNIDTIKNDSSKMKKK